MQERDSDRSKAFLKAHVRVGKLSKMECVVRDISLGGARIDRRSITMGDWKAMGGSAQARGGSKASTESARPPCLRPAADAGRFT